MKVNGKDYPIYYGMGRIIPYIAYIMDKKMFQTTSDKCVSSLLPHSPITSSEISPVGWKQPPLNDSSLSGTEGRKPKECDASALATKRSQNHQPSNVSNISSNIAVFGFLLSAKSSKSDPFHKKTILPKIPNNLTKIWFWSTARNTIKSSKIPLVSPTFCSSSHPVFLAESLRCSSMAIITAKRPEAAWQRG